MKHSASQQVLKNGDQQIKKQESQKQYQAPFESSMIEASGADPRASPLYSKNTMSMFKHPDRSPSPIKRSHYQAKSELIGGNCDQLPLDKPIPQQQLIYRDDKTFEQMRKEKMQALAQELSPERTGDQSPSKWSQNQSGAVQMQLRQGKNTISQKQIGGVLNPKSSRVSQASNQQVILDESRNDENAKTRERSRTPRQGRFDNSKYVKPDTGKKRGSIVNNTINTNDSQVVTTNKNAEGKTPYVLNTSRSDNMFGKARNSVASNASKSFISRMQTQKSHSPSKFGDADMGQLKLENSKLQSTIDILNQKLRVQNDSKDQIVSLREKLKAQIDSSQKLMKDQMNHSNEMAQSKNQIEILKNQVTSLVSTIDQLNKSLREKDEEIDNNEDGKAQLKLDIEELNKNLEEKGEELYEVNKTLHETQTELETTKADLEDATSELEERTRQVGNSKGRIQELMHNLENFVKGEAVYIGHSQDMIDTQLTNFLTQYPEREKMKILFLRESEGVYQFGQRRVNIKLEKGNTIKVRVGGGYMHIDEFLDKYTESEVAKVQRTGAVSIVEKFSNKIQTAQIATSQSKNMYEITPMNTAQGPGGPRRPGSPVKSNTQRSSSPSPAGKPGMKSGLQQSVLTGRQAPSKGAKNNISANANNTSIISGGSIQEESARKKARV